MKLFLMIVIGSLVGCSTMKKSLMLGAGSGAMAGAATGAAMFEVNRGEGALVGALVGGIFGGVASYFIHSGLEDRDDKTRKETLFNLEKFNVSAPRSYEGNNPGLTIPKVEAQWIDTQVQGKKLIEGHRVWIITEDPQWLPSVKKDETK